MYGLRLVADVCSRSSAEADGTYPTSFRIAHYVPSTRSAADWGPPFRVLTNELHWLVPFGETRAACGNVEFEDVIPPDEYGGVESPLGALGYPRGCYGVRLTLTAIVEGRTGGTSTPITTGKRAIVQCGRFRLTRR